MRYLSTTLVVAVFSFVHTAAQQVTFAASVHPNSTLVLTPVLSSYIENRLRNDSVPGLSMGIVHPEGTVELGTWGKKTEEGGHITPDTLFGLASVSKAFLVTSLGILMDDFAHGRNHTPLPPAVRTFDWDTKVKDILPDEWALMDEWAHEKANLRDVLSHVSGLPRHDLSYGPNDKPVDVVRRMRHLRPAFELRQRWSYNNQMFMLGAHIISTYSGMPYPAFTASRIFAPLNMSHSTFSPSTAARDGLLTQCWTSAGRRIPFWWDDEGAQLNTGPGGVISSTEDLTKWLAMLLNKGVNPITNETILQPTAFNEMTTAHAVSRAESPAGRPELSLQGYGMGWFIESYRGHNIIHHSGSIPGFSTEIAFLPDDGWGIVLLMNGDSKALTNDKIKLRTISEFLSLPYTDIHEANTTRTHAKPSDGVRLSLDLEDYAGTYSNAGYGEFTLCAPHSASAYCADVLATFSSVDDLATSPTPTLYAAWPRVWGSHLRMRHDAGATVADTFTMEVVTLFPHGYGANSTAFELAESDSAQVVFVIEGEGESRRVKGVASMSALERTERERLGGSVEDIAEAWFVKE